MRKHLYFTTHEVDHMPWPERRMWAEMIEEEAEEATEGRIERNDDLSALGLEVEQIS